MLLICIVIYRLLYYIVYIDNNDINISIYFYIPPGALVFTCTVKNVERKWMVLMNRRKEEVIVVFLVNKGDFGVV